MKGGQGWCTFAGKMADHHNVIYDDHFIGDLAITTFFFSFFFLFFFHLEMSKLKKPFKMKPKPRE